MILTNEDIKNAGYTLQAAPENSWLEYDEDNPVPGYYEFDWLSSRHPDLYHKFALSSDGLINKLHTIVDLSDFNVIDIGAGTGRSTIEISRKAKSVTAIDVYDSVINFGKKQLEKNNISSAFYHYGDRNNIPYPDNKFDVATCTWAEINFKEAYRIVHNNGLIIQMGAVPKAGCGELTSILSGDYPWLNNGGIESDEVFNSDYPESYYEIDSTSFNEITLNGKIKVYEFTYIAKYRNYKELALITGRLYGRKAKNYFIMRKRNKHAWRLQILIGSVKK